MFDEVKNWNDSQRVKIGDRCHVDENTGLQNTVYNNAVYGSYNWVFTYIS